MDNCFECIPMNGEIASKIYSFLDVITFSSFCKKESKKGHPIGIIFPNGGNFPRHPSQLYEAFFEGFILFLILNLLFYFSKIKSLTGILTGLFILLYGVFRFFIEFFREPDAQLGLFFLNLTLGQILCSVMIIVGLLIIIFSLKYSKSI